MTDYTIAREAMVDCQVRPSDVTKYPIIDALLKTPREEFVPDRLKNVAYVGEHIALNSGRFILDPRTFSKMLDALNIRSDELVLDIAVGSGYSSAVIAHLAEAVVALEDDPNLANEATENLADQGVDNVIVVNALLSSGAIKHGPYDVIVFEGSIEEFPTALVQQLKDGGRVGAVFTNGALGQFRVGIKSDNSISWRPEFDATAPALEGFAKSRSFTFT